jgi:type I restriction enzyme S subunit
MPTDPWTKFRLDSLEAEGRIELGRGHVISRIAMEQTPGTYPVYSSSVHNNGLFGRYGKYLFDEELITWSIDGGGDFFYRPKHRFSVTNVSGYLRVKAPDIDTRFLGHQLQFLHSKLYFDYQHKAHPSVIRQRYSVGLPRITEQRKIAAILSSVDEAIEATQVVLDQISVVRRAMLANLLARGLPGRHTRFKKTEFGEVPEGWAVVPLDSCIESGRPICYGILMPGKGHPGGVPVVKVKNIKNGAIDETDILLTTPELDEQYRRSRLREGDLLLTIRGTTGRVARVPKALDQANITQDTARLSIRSDFCRDFIYYALQGPDLQRQVQDYTRGQAVKGINIGDVRRLVTPVPPYAEQEAIAHALGSISECVAKNRIELIQLHRMKSALLAVLLTGEVRVKPCEEAA